MSHHTAAWSAVINFQQPRPQTRHRYQPSIISCLRSKKKARGPQVQALDTHYNLWLPIPSKNRLKRTGRDCLCCLIVPCWALSNVLWKCSFCWWLFQCQLIMLFVLVGRWFTWTVGALFGTPTNVLLTSHGKCFLEERGGFVASAVAGR